MLNSGQDNQTNLLDLSQQVQRLQRNVREHLSPNIYHFVDGPSQITPGKLIPVSSDDHWLCTVPRHAELEEIIAELERQLAKVKHENRKLEKNLVKKSIKIDALDLANGRKRSRSITESIEAENLHDDIYVLEQQLLRKQREIALAQEQLREMASLSHNVTKYLLITNNNLLFSGCS